ncbi:MAG: O-antigen ligase family protein, partial [Chlamydiales bacterium]
PFHFPEPFQQNIYFFLTDLPLFLFPLLLFSSFSLSTFFTKSSRYLTLLFFVFLFSLLLSSSCPLHYARLSHFFLFIVLFSALEKGLIFQNIRNWFPKIALLIVGLSLVQCLFGILQYCLQNSLGLKFLGEVSNNSWVPFFHGPLSLFGGKAHEMMRRASGTFPHPNVFGGFLLMAIGCSYFLCAGVESMRKKVWLGVALFLQILTLCLTFSRAALIAWLIMTVCWCVFCQRMRVRWHLFASVIGAFLLAFVLLLYPAFKARGGLVNYNKIVKESDEGRIHFQNIAFKMIKAEPLLGVGFNQYVVRMQEFSPTPLKGDQFFPVHNIYLLIAAESGFLGLACFLLFVGSIILRALKGKMDLVTASLLSLLIGLLFIGGCDFYLLGAQHGKLIFFLVTGLLSLSTLERRNVALG